MCLTASHISTSIGAMATETSGTLCFTITGDFLTDHCRSLVLEGRWRDGLATLVRGLPGISTDQAVSVLRGTHRLVGENDLELVEEDRADEPSRYLSTLSWQYAGLWLRPAEGNWQPYAAVTALGRDDVLGRPEMEGISSRQRPDLWNRLRVTYYADSPTDIHTDELPGSDLGLAVLWRRIADPPLWVEGIRSPTDALQDFLRRGRTLERRGADTASGPRRHNSFFDRGLVAEDDAGGTDADDGALELASRTELNKLGAATFARGGTADHLIAQLGLTGKMAEAMEAIVGGEDDHDAIPEPDLAFVSDSGYILPDGRFYGCKYMHHPLLADRLLRLVFDTKVDDPQIEADRRGWLRIQAQVGGGFSFMISMDSPRRHPTKRQEITLADWCIAHQVPYPEVV